MTQNVKIVVPDTAQTLASFQSVGIRQGAVGEDAPVEVALSADPAFTIAQFLAGNSTGLLAIANSPFAEFPVPAGETLVVSFNGLGSAVLTFRTAD